MKKNFLLRTLAVAILSVNVLAMQAEAGVLGLKPSANQGVTQPSGNTNTANTEVQSTQYDTVKYQYPAQQLSAENRQFDKYDWHLFQRFDNHELMYNEWAAAMNFHADEYSSNVVTSSVKIKMAPKHVSLILVNQTLNIVRLNVSVVVERNFMVRIICSILSEMMKLIHIYPFH